MKKILSAIFSITLAGIFLASCDARKLDIGNQGPRQRRLQPQVQEDIIRGGESALEVSGNDLGDLAIRNPGKIVYLDLKNNSSIAISDLSISGIFHPFDFEGKSYPGTSGNCPKELKPGLSCNIAIEVAYWHVPGIDRSSMYFSYRMGQQYFTKSVALTANFKDFAKLSTQNLDFGSVTIGNSKTLNLQLKNDSYYESISNLALKLPTGSKLVINNPGLCANIAPNTTCDLPITFSPTAHAALSEIIDISYESNGQKLSTQVRIDVQTNQDHIGVVGANFATPTVEYDKEGKITLTLNQLLANKVTVKKLVAVTSLGTKLTVDPSSTCLNAKIKNNNTCTFIFKSLSKIQSDLAVNENININYEVAGLAQTMAVTLSGTFKINLPAVVSGLNFGTLTVVHGGSRLITIKITNPNPSSAANATNFKIENTSSILSHHVSSTCKSLSPGESCNLVLEAKPLVSTANYAENFVFKYEIGHNKLDKIVTITGAFNVAPPGSLGSPGTDFITFVGTDFGSINVNKGAAFDITLSVTNNSLTADSAKDFDLHYYDINGNKSAITYRYFIQLSQPKSTCMTVGKNLGVGDTCTLVLELTGNHLYPTTLGLAGKKFALLYKDGGNHPHSQDVSIKGSWTFTLPSPASISIHTPPQAAWPENLTKPVLITSTTISPDHWYQYTKRPLHATPTTPAVPNNYQHWAWLKIPTDTYHNSKHMVWNFTPGGLGPYSNQYKMVKLTDIVPDRVVANGKSYVKMYHGSSSDTILNIFDQGSAKIRFDAATTTAFGDGFYLASDPNESKKYACPPRNPGTIPILLVIGVQEDDAIQGKESSGNLSLGFDKTDPRPAGYNIGDSKDPNIYFRKTTTGNNQFVFFSNVKPYLRILEIISFAKGFGMANSIAEADGIAVGDNTPDANNSYKCNW